MSDSQDPKRSEAERLLAELELRRLELASRRANLGRRNIYRVVGLLVLFLGVVFGLVGLYYVTSLLPSILAPGVEKP